MSANYTRTVGRIEIYAHPTLGGLRKFKVQYRATDAGALTDVTPDTLTLQSRAKGGTATISWDSSSGVYTMTGDFAGINLTVNVAMTDLRIIGTSSNQDTFVIMEVRAMQVLDVSSRVTKLAISQDSDYTLRRCRARSLKMSLDNADNALSYYGTGSYAGITGAGMRFHVFVNYHDTPTEWLNQGTFYLDRWTEPRSSSEVSVTARDGVKRMNTQVQAGYKTGYRNFEIVEYIANLCGIASTDMILDRTSSVIDYFAPKEVDAYDAAQDIAQAAGFSELFFDANGYLQMRATGHTAGNTGIESLYGTVKKVYQPMAELNGKLYAAVALTDLTTLKLAEYDIATSTWTDKGTVSSRAGDFRGGCCVAWDGSVYIVDYFNTNAPLVADVYLTKWDGASTFTQVSYSRATPVSNAVNSQVTFQDGHLFYVNSTQYGGNNTCLINLVTYSFTIVTASAAGALENSNAFVKESGRYFTFLIGAAGAGVKVYEWFPNSGTFTNLNFGLENYSLIVSASLLTIPTTEKGIVYGAAGDGNGTIWVSIGNITAGAGTFTPNNYALYSFDIATFTLVTKNVISNSEGYSGYESSSNAGAYVDGFFLTGYFLRIGANGTGRTRMVTLDTRAGDSGQDIGTLATGGTDLRGFMVVTYQGTNYIYGQLDGVRVFEFQVRRSVPQQTTATFTVSDATGGSLIDLSVEAGDENGGEDFLITEAVVKSRPYYQDSSATLWSGANLPWVLGQTDRPVFKIELSEPAVPSTQAVVMTFTGIATGYIDGTNGSVQHAQQPTVSIVVTAVGDLSDIHVTGNPLRQKATVMNVVFGPSESITRYGIKKYVLENDYIYDTFTQAVIASSLLQRFGSAKARVTGLKTMARWTVQLFDRITLRDSVTGINADFFVAGFAHDYLSQTSTLTVVQV